MMEALRTREIIDEDIDFLVEFIGDGVAIPRRYLAAVLNQLRRRQVPAGFPKYGLLLQSADEIVGAILLIFSENYVDGATTIHCHVTSWYVKPEFRPYASIFYLRALKYKNVTYLNISARPKTWKVIEAQGFKRYSSGQVIALTLANMFMPNKGKPFEVFLFTPDLNLPMDPREIRLLADHASYGCTTICCKVGDEAYPFVFQRQMLKKYVPVVQLIYCRRLEDLATCIAPLSRVLLKLGVMAIRADTNGPIKGVIGPFIKDLEPRWYKGGLAPPLSNLAYTQNVFARLV
jgi:hypothetical protein